MAKTANSPFPEVDFSQWQTWPTLKLPNGEVLHLIPGHPGYVVNGPATNASGRIVIRRNPSEEIKKQQEAEDFQKEQQKQAEFNNSPAGQLLPGLAGTAGTVAGIYALQPGATATGQLINGQMLMSDGTLQALTGAGASQVGATGAQLAAGAPALNAAPAALTPDLISGGLTGDLAGTGGLAGQAGVAAAPSMWMQGLGAAGVGLGAYGAYEGIKKGDPFQSGLGGAGVGLGLNALGYSLGPWGWAAAAGIPALLGASGLFDHETTRERQAKVSKKLMEAAGDDPAAQAYVQSVREQYNSDPADPDNPWFGGKYSSFEDYKKAGLNAADLSHVEGNIDVYTPAVWAKLTQEQKNAVTQANIDSGIYSSKDGGVQITDEAKARENFDNIMKGFEVGVATATDPAVAPALNPKQANPAQIAAAAPLFKRSSTLSPGIGLDGRPIIVTR